jgi:hypothetical protein
MQWILVLFIHAGVMSNSDSVALTNVPGFTVQAECLAAGRAAQALTGGTTKDTRFVCLQRKA